MFGVFILYSEPQGSHCLKWKNTQVIGKVLEQNKNPKHPAQIRIYLTTKQVFGMQPSEYLGNPHEVTNTILRIENGDSIHKELKDSIMYIYKKNGNIIQLEQKGCR